MSLHKNVYAVNKLKGAIWQRQNQHLADYKKRFLFTLFAAYLAQAGFSLMSLFQFHVDGVNALPFYINIAQLVLVPVILVAAAWLISPRKISKLGKAFESTVIAASGFATITLCGLLATVLPMGNLYPYSYTLAPVVMPVGVTVLYVVVLLALRATKRWK